VSGFSRTLAAAITEPRGHFEELVAGQLHRRIIDQ
jgi:hypothetical protein